MGLILHGHNNSFNGVFLKNCHKMLLINVVSTNMASRNNFCTGSVPDPIFLNIKLLIWPHETNPGY